MIDSSGEAVEVIVLVAHGVAVCGAAGGAEQAAVGIVSVSERAKRRGGGAEAVAIVVGPGLLVQHITKAALHLRGGAATDEVIAVADELRRMGQNKARMGLIRCFGHEPVVLAVVGVGGGVAVEIGAGGETACGVVGVGFELSAGQRALRATAHEVVLVARDAAEGVLLGELAAEFVKGVFRPLIERVDGGGHATEQVVFVASGFAFGIGAAQTAAQGIVGGAVEVSIGVNRLHGAIEHIKVSLGDIAQRIRHVRLQTGCVQRVAAGVAEGIGDGDAASAIVIAVRGRVPQRIRAGGHASCEVVSARREAAIGRDALHRTAQGIILRGADTPSAVSAANSAAFIVVGGALRGSIREGGQRLLAACVVGVGGHATEHIRARRHFADGIVAGERLGEVRRDGFDHAIVRVIDHRGRGGLRGAIWQRAVGRGAGVVATAVVGHRLFLQNRRDASAPLPNRAAELVACAVVGVARDGAHGVRGARQSAVRTFTLFVGLAVRLPLPLLAGHSLLFLNDNCAK
jgi:hypothetical protein